MTGRIGKAWRGSGAALTGLAAMTLTACGLRVPPPTPQSTPSPATGSPTPSPSSATPTRTPSPTPTAGATTNPPTTRPATPTSRPTTPRPATPPTPNDTRTPQVVVGRPLRQRRRPLLASVGRGDAPVHPDAERLAAVADSAALATLWLRAARTEHASVPAFAEIALLLAAVGAPLDLVAAAHRAALDEVEHTRLSYALANAYGGTAHAPGALPRLLGRRVGRRRGRTATLRRIAVEALRDGCLNEGYAAALAAAGAATATDPAARHALTRIAADEDRHTELSWRLLGWALAAGGPRVRRAVARALATLPTAGTGLTGRADLEPAGWPSPDTAARVYAATRARVAERAGGLLALSGYPVPVE